MEITFKHLKRTATLIDEWIDCVVEAVNQSDDAQAKIQVAELKEQAEKFQRFLRPKPDGKVVTEIEDDWAETLTTWPRVVRLFRPCRPASPIETK